MNGRVSTRAWRSRPCGAHRRVGFCNSWTDELMNMSNPTMLDIEKIIKENQHDLEMRNWKFADNFEGY